VSTKPSIQQFPQNSHYIQILWFQLHCVPPSFPNNSVTPVLAPLPWKARIHLILAALGSSTLHSFVEWPYLEWYQIAQTPIIWVFYQLPFPDIVCIYFSLWQHCIGQVWNEMMHCGLFCVSFFPSFASSMEIFQVLTVPCMPTFHLIFMIPMVCAKVAFLINSL
jgi:hypothetical protein